MIHCNSETDVSSYIPICKKSFKSYQLKAFLSRGEATRTPDLYVPNVARYQLRYTPILFCDCKSNKFYSFYQEFYLSFIVPIEKTSIFLCELISTCGKTLYWFLYKCDDFIVVKFCKFGIAGKPENDEYGYGNQ